MRPELALVLDIAQAVADVELCMGGRDLTAFERIVAFRNVLVHAYHGVDLRRVHELATVEVPKLNAWLLTVVPPKP